MRRLKVENFSFKRKIIIFVLLFLCYYHTNAKNYENTMLGFKFELPVNWDSVAALEDNKPQSVFEVIRNNNLKFFFTFVIYPTHYQSVTNEGLSSWQQRTSNSYG